MHEMPDHKIGLYLLACLGVIALGIIILIERHLQQKEARVFDDFDASPAGRDLQVQKDRFWQLLFEIEAEGRRQQHLNESEAAAIAAQHDHQPQQ